MTRTFTCILCPNGCEITVEHENKQVLSCTGNQCKKGLEYVTQELQDPRRTVTSSVLVSGGVRPLAGTVVLSNVFGYGCDLIVTSGVEKE